MPPFPAFQSNRCARRGVALVVVLAFVLLLTAIAVAFFSRALSERQISNLAVNQIKVDALAQGAADTVISDFRQEIAAGSLAYTPSTNYAKSTNATVEANTLFVPKASATMVPAVVLAGTPASPSTPAASPTPGLENLIKQSAGGQPFFPTTNTNYDASTYQPSTRAPKGTSANSATSPWEASSAKPSLNGRFISLARWNKPLLLPATSATDPTPKFDAGQPFLAPDWVLVARDGSNPTAWNSNMTSTASTASTVVGRFAYNVYDEGGLLDANVAGFPAPSTTSDLPVPPATPAPNGSSTGIHGYNKSALAYADLTQLVESSDPTSSRYNIQVLTQAQIDALVGWRNNASAQAPNAFPNPGFTNASRTAYYTSTLLNPTGFLSINGLSGLTSNNQSDRMFSGRQTLINLMKVLGDPKNIPNSDPAKTQDALRFLGTFSRSLNQPSFVRVQSIDQSAPGYDSTAPKLLAPGKGGNNAGGDTSGTGTVTWNPPLDNQINPTFLAVRVPKTQSGGRFDGTDLTQGEPLVKKRFPLNRLAWLTYRGPSAQNMSDPVVQQTITAMGGDPSNTSDPVYLFVQQGTADNIKKCFGLTWDTVPNIDGSVNGWKYNVHNGGGSGTGAIMKVGRPSSVTSPDANSFVQDAGREPDFFELLKASINAGSIAKAGTLPPSSSYLIPHFGPQYDSDSRVDNAIIQIGANIIDQFDLDNYPTHISFNDGTGTPYEIYGVENLPYLYDVHPVVLKVAPPVTAPAMPGTSGLPSSYYYNTDNTALSTGFKVTDTGIGATMLIPELWNPHDWDASTTQKRDQTLGIVQASPTSFRIYARSARDPSATPDAVVLQAKCGDEAQTDALDIVSNGYLSRGFPVAGEPRKIDESNSIMTFAIPHDLTGAQLFREPTLLYRPNHPTYSQLACPALASKTNLGALVGGVPGAFAAGGLIAAVGDPVYPPVVGTTANPYPYIGIYLGSVPLLWQNKTSNPNLIYRDRFVTLDKNLYPHGVQMTFYLQYQDAGGNWVTFDEKHVTLGHKGIGWGKIAAPMHQSWAGFLEPTLEGDRHYFVLDPRTSRFGMQTSSIPGPDPNPTSNPPYYVNTWGWPPFQKNFPIGDGYQAWISQNEGILPSLRDGWGIGGNLQMIDNAPNFYDLVPYNFPAAMGFYPGNQGNNTIWTWVDATHSLRFGVFSQNSPHRFWADRLNGDGEWIGSGANTYNNSSVDPQFFADADGVVRRGMGGWADISTTGRGRTISSWSNNYAELMGLPMRRAHVFTTGDNQLHKTDIFKNYPPNLPSSTTPLLQTDSRPMILNHPFRSVAELGYTFSGTPWRNLTFSTPESGDSALLDVFCVNDTDNTDGLVAGKVNLNTRQPAVLKAILTGAYKSEWDSSVNTASASALAEVFSRRLVARTSGFVPIGANAVTINGSGVRPLQNLSDLVGRWSSQKAAGSTVQGFGGAGAYFDATSFDGFSADLFNPQYFATPTTKTLNGDATDDPNQINAIVADKTIGRRRDTPIRALANVGQTRVWNLLIDVVAQTGRYPQTATAIDKFAVEGEQRYWVHVAIDRFTGNVIDKQIEVVNE